MKSQEADPGVDRRRGPSDTYGQGCPVALGLDVIGDRWSLLVLRDLAHAPLRFRDLQAVNPRLSPNLLTKRLRQLEDDGLVERRLLPPPASVVVYALTDDARAAVLPILHAVGRFGARFGRPAEGAPADLIVEQLRRNGHWVLAKGIDDEAALVLDFGGTRIGVTVGPTVFQPSVELPEHPAATIRVEGAVLANLFHGGIGLPEAEASGQLAIEGDRGVATRFLAALSLAELSG